MNYIFSDKNTLIWLMFTIYAMTALFIVPNAIAFKTSAVADKADDCAIGFASRLLLRVAFIVPMIFIIKNTI